MNNFFSDSILILLLYAELILFVFVVKMNAMWMWCKVQKKIVSDMPT